MRKKPVSRSDPNVRPGAEAVPLAALNWPVIAVCPSLATLFVISAPTSEKLAFTALDWMVVPLVKLFSVLYVPLPLRGMARSSYAKEVNRGNAWTR